MQTPDSFDSPAEMAAAEWLARRDRGLTPREQEAYRQWLQSDEANVRAVARLEKCWQRLDALRQWRPQYSAAPNVDLLAARRRTRWRPLHALALAAAACVALGVFAWRPWAAGNERADRVVHRGPEKLMLTDGSLVELNQGARIDVQFTAAERRVRLMQGDAHFTVAKNPARPFVVVASRLAVRAVGTAFAVQTGAEKMSVLVTEGRVRLDDVAPGRQRASMPPRELLQAVAGQEVVIDPRSDGERPLQCQVRELTPLEMDNALSWRALRLEFQNSSLDDVVAELNRFSARKLVVADAATGQISIAGTFRADNVDAFVRLLDMGFGVTAESRGDEIVLRRR